jgi:lipid-A-disaccharide synthase
LRPPFIFLIAGEASGDYIGARLMAALKERTQGAARFAGVGGERMEAEGLASLFPMRELSLMGVAEIVPRLPTLLRRLRQTARAAIDLAPDAVVLIDAQGFSARLARRLFGRGFPLIQYVAPTVWAWKPGRAAEIAKALDHILLIYPFETPYFERVGLASTFVGHPIVESGADRGDGARFRMRHGLADGTPLLAVLPGSRSGETWRLLPAFGEAVAILSRDRPGLVAAVPTVPAVEAEVRAAAATWPLRAIVTLGDEEKYDAFAAASVALAASGTVALEIVMAGLPLVIGYRVHPITGWLARRLLRVRYINVVNIIMDREVIPELVEDRCRPDLLAAAVARLLDDREAAAAQLAACRQAAGQLGLGHGSPSRRAAEAVMDLIATASGRHAPADV